MVGDLEEAGGTACVSQAYEEDFEQHSIKIPVAGQFITSVWALCPIQLLYDLRPLAVT